jgi:hypothetical protein
LATPVYWFQSPGAMAPYAVAWILVGTIGDLQAHAASLRFRILFLCGSIPAVLVGIASYYSRTDIPDSKVPNPIETARLHPQYYTLLCGTGGSWLLYDVAYYGTNVFTPHILE